MTSKISSACLMSVSLLLGALIVIANAEMSSVSALEKGGTLNKIQGVKVANSDADVKNSNLEEVVNSNIEGMFDEEMDGDIEHDEDDEEADEDEDEVGEDEEGEDVGELEIVDRDADIDYDDDDDDDDDNGYANDDEEHEEEEEADVERITGVSGATTDVDSSIKTEMGNKKGVNVHNN